MEEKKSCCCKSLPKVLWWFLALFGLALIYLLMFNMNKDRIEEDLTHRVTGALSKEGMSWVSVDVDERGRDILLIGDAPNEEARSKALSLAAGVDGVRIVENGLKVAVAQELLAPEIKAGSKSEESTVVPPEEQMPEPIEAMSLHIQIDDSGKMVLNGKVASKEELEAILKAAQDKVGEDNVINNLMVSSDVKPSSWLDALPDLLGLATSGGALSVGADGVQYTGSVENLSMMNQIIDKAKSLLSSFNIPVLNNLIVDNVVSVDDSVAMTLTPVAEPDNVIVKAEDPSPEVKAVNRCQGMLNESMSGKTINFVTNRANIKSDSYPILDAIEAVMKECKAEIANNGVTINGHTDSRGDDTYNMSLSLRRANAVRNYLVGKGVDEGLLKSIGHGETNPVAGNDTVEGRAANRRITFIIQQNN